MSNESDLPDPKPSWKTRWVLRRNRVLGSAKFQKWAARTPVFRTVARRKAAHQFNLIAGFVYTQIITIFVETGLIDFLRQDMRTTRAIIDFLPFDTPATDRLLRAGAALDVVESPQAGLWTLGETGAALSANAGAMAMIRHHQLLFRDLADPVALFSRPPGRDTQLSDFWTYAGASGEDSAPYSRLMAATQPMVWQQILPRYDFADHKRMLDIGGGSGAFVEAISGIAPELETGIFDLPAVTALAREKFAGEDVRQRVVIHSGSFRQDSIPTGYDLITLVRILHDHDDDVVEALLPRIHAALPKGGKLLIVEPMAETAGAEPMGDAYFGLYLWAMGSGRPRSLAENVQLLEKAGFSRIQEIKTDLPIITRAIVATR